MRPMFVFLSAKLFGKFEENTYRAASMIELLHTATLVHDDVIDEANFRRGFFSINSIWKNKIAVLVGDFLLSRGLLLAVKNEEFELLKIMSTAVQDMSEGELLQIEKARKLDITEEVYFDIIRQKTASLIAACCASGANSVGQNKEVVERMRLFGEKAGIAFQIKDDLLDYSEDAAVIGKPVFQDLREGKVTYPFFFAYKNADESEKIKLESFLGKKNLNQKNAFKLISKLDGIKETEMLAFKYIKEASKSANLIEDKTISKEMIELVNSAMHRKK